jgi:cytochrome c oxidase subunit II
LNIHSLLAFLQVQAANVPERKVADIFKPLASPGESEKQVALLTFAITGAIFVVVGSLIVYTIARFRSRPGDDLHQEPPQVYGSNQIEVAWTVIPILIVFVLIGVTARVVAGVQNASPPKTTTHVRVIGHQWWWEVEYPDYHIRTANEIHVPFSPDGAQATYFVLQSIDVAHSFWIPQLSGKTDVIPNRDNYLWMNPKAPGYYYGNCAEYCGTQHANMQLRLVAESPEDFKKWTLNQQKKAADAAEGKAVFESLSCVNCHAVQGTTAIGKFGPDLTHLMSRREIGSGVVENTHKNLRDWVNDPQAIKPGCLMPSFKLTDRELDQVVAYLETLK